ncbi:MAG: hypothetical protein WA913_08140 [Pricia sp.]
MKLVEEDFVLSRGMFDLYFHTAMDQGSLTVTNGGREVRLSGRKLWFNGKSAPDMSSARIYRFFWYLIKKYGSFFFWHDLTDDTWRYYLYDRRRAKWRVYDITRIQKSRKKNLMEMRSKLLQETISKEQKDKNKTDGSGNLLLSPMLFLANGLIRGFFWVCWLLLPSNPINPRTTEISHPIFNPSFIFG